MPGWRILQALMSCQLSKGFLGSSLPESPYLPPAQDDASPRSPLPEAGRQVDLTSTLPDACLCGGFCILHNVLNVCLASESLPAFALHRMAHLLCLMSVAGRRVGLTNIHCRVSLLCNLHCALVAAFSMLPLQYRFAHGWELPGDKNPVVHLRTAIAKVTCRRLQPGLVKSAEEGNLCMVQVLVTTRDDSKC